MAPVCAVCLFVFVISNQSTSRKPCHLCQTLISLTPCCIMNIVAGGGGSGVKKKLIKGGGEGR